MNLKMHKHLGRLYEVMAEFPESSPHEANRFMEKTPGASVLAVADGKIIIANAEDSGIPAQGGVQ